MVHSGVAKGRPGQARAHPNVCCEVEKYRDTLIEQSNILIKQSVGQVVHCQLTESGYATDGTYQPKLMVHAYTYILYIIMNNMSKSRAQYGMSMHEATVHFYQHSICM